MVIRAVVFDIGGVLEFCEPMDFDRRWEAALGLADGAFDAALADVWAGGAVGTVTEAEVHAAIRERLGLSADQVDAVLADMWRQYLGTPNTDLIAYARGLRPAYRTGILSNSFVGAREREQAAYGLTDLVDDCVYSHEVGLSKPDPAAWELICRRMDVAPTEMVFVDDFPGNVTAAAAHGMTAVLFRTTDQVIADLEALLR
ncbi:HAD family phosphatase [Asanoa sp. WMMD1127]|uniref:HAD family hydrolase n=1 Tax=Asanoa sp. WMMD1127 TaxID=3016107 RepID=UPI002415EAB8|nr:HAD family phosphatase [Asanoa sp. WMMD1127]MDG4826352.1 HAD family phosphatase [Asanoa sp. WMMD1127]